MEFQYSYQDDNHKLDLTPHPDNRFTALIGNREIELSATHQGDGIWLLIVGNRRIRAHIVSDGEARYIHINGKTIMLNLVDERSARRKQTRSAGDLTAQMPGQVVEVLVSEGDTVTSGQALVILEAMKMEIRVTAQTDGIVAGVFVTQNDVVQRGQRLVEITT